MNSFHSSKFSNYIKRFYLLPLAAITFTAWASPAISALPHYNKPDSTSEALRMQSPVQVCDTLKGRLGKPSGADQEPEFSKGGLEGFFQYMTKNIRYPKEAKRAGIQGKVVVKFLIEKDGTVNHVRVWRSADPDLDQEAVRLISAMPKWKPAQLNGEPVIVEYTVPVFFRINQ